MRDFKLTRREFVKGCGSAAIVSATGGTLMFADPVDAAVNSYDTVVHLFLRGGLDGLNLVVPTGGAREAAIALAQQLAAFPQATMRADRESAYRQWDLPLPQALHQEWARGRGCIADALTGATRFTGGAGRHGQF